MAAKSNMAAARKGISGPLDPPIRIWLLSKKAVWAVVWGLTHHSTVEENGAGFTGVSEISPVRFPSLARRVPKPSPCIKLWDILLDSGCLIPVEAGLQKCSFDVLNQCSLGEWQVLERLGTIREKVMSSFIYTAGTTALAVHDDDHTLQSLDMNVIVDLFRLQADPELCEAECVEEADGKDDNIAVDSPDKCLFMAIGPSMCKMQDYSCICFWMITRLKGRHVIPWSVGE
ncbi:unnamed protein product [Leuciscus chuanchicus]